MDTIAAVLMVVGAAYFIPLEQRRISLLAVLICIASAMMVSAISTRVLAFKHNADSTQRELDILKIELEAMNQKLAVVRRCCVLGGAAPFCMPRI